MSLFSVNPDARLSRISLHDGRDCLVVDDFLLEPEHVRAYAAARSDDFSMLAYNRFPGPEIQLGADQVKQVVRWWKRDARSALKLSRIVHQFHARMSIVTHSPEQLSLVQRFCHRDGAASEVRGNVLYAGVLYLFDDADLGGTAFYRNINPDWRAVIALAGKVGEDALKERYPFFGQAPCYMTESNEFFERTFVVPPAFNRIIFYPGDIFHSGHITHPEKLSRDPLKGRLTINFFVDAVKPV